MEFRRRVTVFYRQILWMVSCLLTIHGVFLLGMLALYFYTKQRFFIAILISHGLIYLLMLSDLKRFVRKALDTRKVWYKNLGHQAIIKEEQSFAKQSLTKIKQNISKYIFLFIAGLLFLSLSLALPFGDFQLGSGIGLTFCGSSGLIISSLLQWTFNYYHNDMLNRY